MSVSCQILLNRPSEGVYRAGDEVTGTIKYAINEPMEVNDITLSLVGEAFSQWVDRGPISKYTIYTGREEIISINQSLLEMTTSTLKLQCGSYEKQFSFALPYDIPPSFEDKNSHIKYLVKLKFLRPGLLKTTKRFKTEIKVTNYVDPNTSEEPVAFGLEKNLIVLFSGKKNIINLRAELAKPYSPPGQRTFIKVFMKNDANIKIPSIKTELFSKTIYTAKGGRTKVSIDMFKQSTIDSPPVYKKTEANLSSYINIPPGLYSVQSKVVSKQYIIRITLNLPFLHIDSFVDMPIVIGDKRDTNQEVETPGDQNVLHQEEDKDIIEEQVVKETKTDEPPSYWEAMQEDH